MGGGKNDNAGKKNLKPYTSRVGVTGGTMPGEEQAEGKRRHNRLLQMWKWGIRR